MYAKVLTAKRAMLWFAALLACVGLIRSLIFTLSTGNKPWFEPRLSIDGPSYVEGMKDIGSTGDFLRLKDIYHSPGYQLYLGGIYSLCGADRAFRCVKLLAWAMAALCVAMVFWLGEHLFGSHVGAVAATLLALSYKWTAYANLLQYEIPLAFLLTGLVLLSSGTLLRADRFRVPLAFLAGLCLTAACFVHFRMLLLIPLAAWSMWAVLGSRVGPREKQMSMIFFLLPSILAVGSWSTYQTLRRGKACVIQQLDPWARQFRLHNHAQAQGVAYPYIEPVEPSGLQFIIHKPVHYLWLIGERFLCLWDFHKDIWYVGPQPSWYEWGFHLAACIFFFAGAAFKLGEDIRKGLFGETAILYFVALAVLAGPLLSTGSSRFLVPLLPIACLFQSYASVRAQATIMSAMRTVGAAIRP